jgi:hypothetical protein
VTPLVVLVYIPLEVSLSNHEQSGSSFDRLRMSVWCIEPTGY